MRRLVTALLATVLVCALITVGSTRAQDGAEPVVETDPAIPTVNQSVTITFNADQGDKGLEGFDGTVHAHTGVFTDESPNEWRCVKNNWPTSDDFTGNRSDTDLTQVGPDTYELTIEDVRSFYNDNETGCTLGSDETIQTMNFVFRSSDGSKEGKAEGGEDIIVDLGDPDASVLADITSPSWSLVDPIVVGTDTSFAIEAAATADSLESFRLLVDGAVVKETQESSLTDTLSLDAPGRRDVRVEATDNQGNTASDSLYAVRASPTEEQAVPPGLEDGINYTGGGNVTLVLQAPEKQFVHLVGDFTDWEVQPEYQMYRETNTTSSGQDSTRYWVEISGLSSGQEYGFQYLVDGEIRIPDPYTKKALSPNDSEISESTYPNLKPYPTGKANQLVSVLEPGQEDFNFSTYDRPEQEDLVIYELLVRDFIENHDYETLQDTLDYFDRMGVNAIELMPVSEYDGNQSWGYNPALYFATDKYYGPAEDLKEFIDLAHQRGIAVILDVVYNQQTGQSPFIRLFNEGEFGPPTEDNPWANAEAKHPFNVFNDNNHESSFTKYWLDRANEYWLTEFNVDGFRFDLSKGFTQGPNNDGYTDVGSWAGPDQERIGILKRMADEIWAVDDSAYVILEHFAAPEEEQELASYRADETGGMMLWNNMNEPYSQAAKGEVEGSGFRNTYYENRGLSEPNYITYMESHDEQWLMYRNLTEGNSSGAYDIQTLETALNRQKLVGAFFFTVPGPRMLWQFGELGYGFGENGEQCLNGTGDNCPSIAPGRTSPKPIRWDYRDPAQSPDRVRLYKTWSALINLRNQQEVFTDPETDVSLRVGSETRGRRIELQHPSMNVVIIGNFGVTPREVAADFPSTGSWYDFFTGKELQIESDEQGASIPLDPGEFHIYTDAPVDTPESGLVPYGTGAPPPEPPTDLTTTSDVEAGSIQLSWAASSSSDVTGYQLYRGTEASFDTTDARIATLDPGVTSYADTVEDDRVYYYRVVALDNDGARSALSESVSGLLYPETLSVGISQSFGERSSTSDYRLVALPGDVRRGVGSTFSGQAGEDWQVYRDNGTESDFFEAFDGSSSFEFRPGRGFWAISDSSWSVQDEVSTVPLRTTTAGLAAVVPLRDGWNIISNPIDKDVDWGQVEAANGGDLQPIWRFDGAFQQATTFSSARKGEAFYFHNRGGRSQLRIPYSATSSSGSESSTESAALLTLAAEGPDNTASRVRVGRAANADDGVGKEDVLAPPSRFETVSLRVQASSDTSSRTNELMRSVQGTSDEGNTFDLRLRGQTEQPIVMTLETDRLPSQFESLRLINRQTGASFDLRSQQQVELSPKTEETTLTLLAGTDAYVEKKQSELVPDELKLWANYPNPFRERTTVEYTLPEAGTVTVEVFDILGRRVSTLVDGHQEEGLHRLDWSPGSQSGGGISSGVYILRVSMDGTSRTQKMTVIR